MNEDDLSLPKEESSKAYERATLKSQEQKEVTIKPVPVHHIALSALSYNPSKVIILLQPFRIYTYFSHKKVFPKMFFIKFPPQSKNGKNRIKASIKAIASKAMDNNLFH